MVDFIRGHLFRKIFSQASIVTQVALARQHVPRMVTMVMLGAGEKLCLREWYRLSSLDGIRPGIGHPRSMLSTPLTLALVGAKFCSPKMAGSDSICYGHEVVVGTSD
eukprot:SAG31_NODE_112_length_24420_cov_19.787550_3_plen_107_part_00